MREHFRKHVELPNFVLDPIVCVFLEKGYQEPFFKEDNPEFPAARRAAVEAYIGRMPPRVQQRWRQEEAERQLRRSLMRENEVSSFVYTAYVFWKIFMRSGSFLLDIENSLYPLKSSPHPQSNSSFLQSTAFHSAWKGLQLFKEYHKPSFCVLEQKFSRLFPQFSISTRLNSETTETQLSDFNVKL
jgi:hypothetical protein